MTPAAPGITRAPDRQHEEERSNELGQYLFMVVDLSSDGVVIIYTIFGRHVVTSAVPSVIWGEPAIGPITTC